MVKFIDRDPHWYTCRVKEAIHMRLHSNNINRDSGIEIPEAWTPTIKNPTTENDTTANFWGNSYSQEQWNNGRIEMHQSQLKPWYKWFHVIGWPHCLKMTSRMIAIYISSEYITKQMIIHFIYCIYYNEQQPPFLDIDLQCSQGPIWTVNRSTMCYTVQ